AWLFLGESGVGKTTMAQALAAEIGAEVHHIPSRNCDLENVESVVRWCHYVPLGGRFHLVLVDEADQMTLAAQHAFLSKLDSTATPPDTIFVFTANATQYLEDRFLSRCRLLEFSGHNIGRELPAYLAQVWKKETRRRNGLDFRRLAKDANHNVRDALSRLEVAALGAGVPDEPSTLDRKKPVRTIYHERAAKAVATMKRNAVEAAKKEKP
ncbi:MAG: AAA family ATPase, partial [Acidobacteria bacterium]|nr:AAA family ATPase [Acidobacteriota bacterium]